MTTRFHNLSLAFALAAALALPALPQDLFATPSETNALEGKGITTVEVTNATVDATNNKTNPASLGTTFAD